MRGGWGSRLPAVSCALCDLLYDRRSVLKLPHGSRACCCWTFLCGGRARAGATNRGYSPRGTTQVRALGCVVPHAGYMYSGHVAGAVYSSIEIPSRCILLGPRHFPQGQPMAILTEGSFATPLGKRGLMRNSQRNWRWNVRCFGRMRLRTRANTRWKCRFPFCSSFAGIFDSCR